jgi:hypothetical protein
MGHIVGSRSTIPPEATTSYLTNIVGLGSYCSIGIFVDSVAGVIIRDNVIVRPNSCGISLFDAVDHVQVVGNQIQGAAGGAAVRGIEIYSKGNETSSCNYIQISENVLTTPRHRNRGYVTESHGAAASITDGGTIAHGCAAAPTVATVSGSVAGEIVTVTSIDATNITVAIKAADGTTPGTSQTVYWRAEV